MKSIRRKVHKALVSLATIGMLAGVVQTVPAAAASAAEPRPTFTITTVASGLNLPWDVAQTPDGTLIFDQRFGGLSVLRPNGAVSSLRADFSDLFALGETGLMGLVLDPGFASNRRLYTCQGHQAGTDKEIQVIAWTVDAGYTAATRVSDPLLGDIPVNASTGRHGGCRLRFDSTGSLMVSTGDNAVGRNPQDLTSLAGKILRINPMTGAPAADNPRINSANPNTRLLWNYGHRNPQGLALRGNGQMFNVEHGPSIEDEVNLVLRNRNYGWDPVGAGGSYNELVPMTDLQKFPNAKPASYSSGPTDATCGATFLDGPQWKAWNGSMVVAQLQGESLLRLTFGRGGRLTSQELIPEFSGTYGRLRTAQLGTDGSLYLTTSNGGGGDVILRVSPTG
jgi:glucose/arabinose dehydrogenase